LLRRDPFPTPQDSPAQSGPPRTSCAPLTAFTTLLQRLFPGRRAPPPPPLCPPRDRPGL